MKLLARYHSYNDLYGYYVQNSGLIADISLLIYVGLIGLAMGIFHVNLSLSGIAGIVLSIGMAVDADCIIFERMKEELKVGKTIRASVSAGLIRHSQQSFT